MRPLFCLLPILATVLLSSCGRQTEARQDGGDTVVFKYARRLSVVRHDGYTEVTLQNPWQEGKTLHRYTLVPHDAPLPEQAEGTVVRTPLRRSAVFTTVHCALLQMLHAEESIAGVADLKYIKLPYVHEQVRAGRIADCGEAMSPTIERLLDLRPDAVLLSPFENSGGYGRLEGTDVPLVECADYMEPTPLGRAEWVRFYGMLFGCEQRADSLFAVVDSSYQALKEVAGRSKTVRSVVVDKLLSSTWYVPGGRSTIGQMLADARCSYPWAADEHGGSVPLTFESVLERAGECDVWLLRYSGNRPLTCQELAGEYRGYDRFKAFRQREVYGCNVAQSLFYEESPFRPDWLLADFIRMLHPDVQELPPLRYFQKLP